jgi:outer membrane protein assembly factor BamB
MISPLSRHLVAILGVWLSVSVSVTPTPAAEPEASWPQWRGASRDGRVAAADWPESLDANHLKMRWRIELPASYSGPIVAGNRVFTTATRESDEEAAIAFDLTTGQKVWETVWTTKPTNVPFFAARNGSWIRATPAFDGTHLFVPGMRDVLVCLDAATGKVAWRVDFPESLQTPAPSFGFVCSPLVDGDALYVQAGASLVKLNKANGQVLWRTLETRGSAYDSAFSSPVIATVCDKRQLIVQTRTDLAGVDLDSGAVLWKQPVKAFRGMNILTPTVSDNRLFTSSYGGSTVCFTVSRDGDAWTVKPLWTNKQQGYMCSPVVLDDHVYLSMRSQRFTCINLTTARRPGPAPNASPTTPRSSPMAS